jgi:hypothetical protein
MPEEITKNLWQAGRVADVPTLLEYKSAAAL